MARVVQLWPSTLVITVKPSPVGDSDLVLYNVTVTTSPGGTEQERFGPREIVEGYLRAIATMGRLLLDVHVNLPAVSPEGETRAETDLRASRS